MMEEQSDDENAEPAPKKIKREWVKSYSEKAMEMMKKMGYENDKGLGKSNQGRLEPVIAVQQDGRRGFGLKLDAANLAAGQWDPSCEELEMPETVKWLTNVGPNASQYTLDQLMGFVVRGERKRTLEDENRYCDPEVLHHILNAKSAFDDLNDIEKRRARSRCNPFETIRSSIFLNRAAVKMANIDSMCDFMFTNPRDLEGRALVDPKDLLYFTDMCAGPGGFSEYVLFRKSWEAKGFGFTLRGANDFKLEKFFAASPESFDTYYGVKDDGNIFDDQNQDSLNEYIRYHTPEGVHFAMADGGFSVEGEENIQEILSKQLYLCQCLTALKILRKNGNFVCKLFDLFTPFSVGLIYLMYKCFHQIAIIKPNSSRPANSERYLVCKYKLEETTDVINYMNTINVMLNEERESVDDILEIFDANEIAADGEFVSYVIESNNAIGRKQITGLHKLSAFAQNPELKETRQSEVRQQCLKMWALPDKLRKAPEAKPPDHLLKELLLDWSQDRRWLNIQPIEMNSVTALANCVQNVRDWIFMPIGREETNNNSCSLFMCRSRGHLLRYTEHKKWEPVETSFEVQARSIFFGQIVSEFYGEGRTIQRVPALHIIDGICLGGIDIRRRALCDRISMCDKYARSLNKPYKKERTYGPLRSNPYFRLPDMQSFFGDMRQYVLKDSSKRFGFSLDDNKFFVPGGILMLCELTPNYMSAKSRSRNQIYYFNTNSRESFYKDDVPKFKKEAEIFGSFRQNYIRRLLWKWTDLRQVEEHAHEDNPNLLFRSQFVKFIADELDKLGPA
ncbi:cap-specific mRNA (nucleoside-2'-O-)-methyltransferase 1 [Drosophila madeirensis]|uniref:Cap-specific mRNA (nucleoside-2'-O-)-methyltransferase 1 n=1 Tax=Drosophila madeirensis TaxID=30013 RepID=A0AAU9G2E7_DROMD